MEERDEAYEPPAVTVLGTLAELTSANTIGPNTDLTLNAPSFP